MDRITALTHALEYIGVTPLDKERGLGLSATANKAEQGQDLTRPRNAANKANVHCHLKISYFSSDYIQLFH